MMVKLTKDQYLKAGAAIMADARCTSDVKAAVRRGTDGTVDADGKYTYRTEVVQTWYDDIVINAAKS